MSHNAARVSATSLATVDTQALSETDIELKPWKFVGYRRYAEFLNSDDDFCVVRRFGTLNLRVILALQDKITVLEEELESLDRAYSRKEAEDENNGRLRDDIEERSAILDQLSYMLERYNNFVLRYSELRARPQAPEVDVKNIQTWHKNHDSRAIVKEEHKYLKHKRDLFSLVPRVKAPVRRMLERSRWFRKNRLWRNKGAAALPSYEQDLITYTSDQSIDNFTTFIVVLFGLAMILAPIWILSYVNPKVIKLGVITIFIVVFLGIISYATTSSQGESLAATAAYSAVLMVFLQLGTTS